MIIHCLAGYHFFPVWLQVGQGLNPMRALLIGGVGLLWLMCFISLFLKDKRKAKLRYLAKRKHRLGYIEKRRDLRISYPMPVRYRILAPRELMGTIHVSNARDLSEHGILLETKEDLPMDARLELKLALSTSSSIYVHGIVRRKEWLASLGIHAVGIALEASSPQDQEKLVEFIEIESSKEQVA